MKTLALIISFITFWSLSNYGQSENVNQLLEKQETRTEIFNSILNNHELMTEFIHAMKNNNHAMMMMRSDSEMMGNPSMGGMHNSGEQKMMCMNNESSSMNHQMHQGEMMGMMKDNPEMMMNMMGNMMDMCKKDSIQCKHMAEVMSEHPQMMQMCMQKMKEKGMMGADGKMKMMNNSGEINDTVNHHMHK